MTLRISNTAFLEVLDAVPAEAIGWELEVVSPEDWATVWAMIPAWKEMSIQRILSDAGTGTFTLREDDSSLVFPLPSGESGTYADRGPLIRVKRNGLTKFEWIVQEVIKPRVSEDGTPGQYVFSGPGTGSILETGIVLPYNYPSENKTTRSFNQPLMQTWVQLFNEAKLRGCFPHVLLTFSETLDTTGTPWPSAQKMDLDVGDNLYDLLNEWVSQMGYTWIMLPGYKLAVYPSYGNLRQDEVVFYEGQHLRKNEIQISREGLANVVFSDIGDADGIVFAYDSTSVAEVGRREAWVDAGDTEDASATQAFVNANLRLLKDPDKQYQLEVDHTAPTRVLFDDWDYGDTVGVEASLISPAGKAFSIEAHRIVGVTLAVKEDGGETCEIVLSEKEEVRQPPVVEIKKQQKTKQGGKKTKKKPTKKRSPKKAAKTIVKTTQLNELSDVEYTAPTSGDVLVWDEGDNRFETRNLTLDLLEDVVAGTPTVGQVLKWNGTAWVPSTDATGGGGGGGGASPGDLAAEILLKAPYGFWALDETSGTTMNNQGSEGTDGTITGTYTLDQDVIVPGGSGSVWLNGSSGWIGVGTTNYDSLTSWTVCACILPLANGLIVCTKYPGSGGVNIDFEIGVKVNNERLGAGRFSSGWGTIEAAGSIIGRPSFVVATLGGGNCTLWVNGKILKRSALSVGSVATGGELRIGNRWDGGNYFSGYISDVAIWNSVLSDSDIRDLSNAAF